VTRCGCRERVAEDVYHTTPLGMEFGAGSSSAGASHDDDVPNLGPDLDAMTDVLSQLEGAPDPM
jgi:hypothetical protein